MDKLKGYNVSDRWKVWTEQHPWYRSYNNARERCKPNGKYGKRGIKFLMTMKDFEFLWERDFAYALENPSIDRIKDDKNYTLDNCRFIEHSLNANLGNIGIKSHLAKLKDKDIIKIRKMYAAGGITHQELGAIYGVHDTNIGAIIRKKTWRHL